MAPTFGIWKKFTRGDKMTIKEFYEYILSIGAENFTLCSEEWGNVTKEEIIVNFEHEYVSI